MSRTPDTFRFPAELGQRLRDLRLRAGLTQPGLAQVMGRTGKGKASIVSRLEKGRVPYPSLGLIADFLRGCRARFKDISDILDLYTELPTTQRRVFCKALARVAASVPEKWQPMVTQYDLKIEYPKPAPAGVRREPRPDPMTRLDRARKNAAAAHRRFLYGQYLTQAVDETGQDQVMTVRVPLFNHGLAWFRILYRTRKARPAVRERLLAASHEEFAKVSGYPPDTIRKLEDGVRQRFAELEASGQIDWLPDLVLDEYEAGLFRPVSKRQRREEQLREYARKADEYAAARKELVERVWQEVQSLLDEAAVPKERRPVYRGLVGICSTVASSSEPGSAREKAQVDAYIMEPHWIQLGLDTAVAQRLADVTLARFRELAGSLPPDPRPQP